MPSADPAQSEHAGAPLSLRVAGVLAGVQGVVTLAIGVTDVFSVDGDRVVVGVTTSLFFVAYGALLAVCGVALWRPTHWARGPVLFAQLVWLGVAWSLHSGSATWLAVLVAVSAVVCLLALLRPAAIRAVDGDRFD